MPSEIGLFTPMLSYQHAYHAGGPADVHKHMVLAELIARLTAKPRCVSYVETHAGRGLYDLGGVEAAKTGEAAAGVARLAPDPGTPFGRALAAVRTRHGNTAYPGSPLLAHALLRADDRITLMELHPAEHAALRALAAPGIAIHRRNGYEGVLALAPFDPRKGLVLVDPSYELKSEYRRAAEFARRLVPRWPQATVMIWYPLLAAGRHRELLEGLRTFGPLVDEVGFAAAPGMRMTGSGIALVNPPYGAANIFRSVHAAAAAVVSPIPPPS